MTYTDVYAVDMLPALGVFILFLMLLLVVCYVIDSYGWYSLYKQAGYVDNAWMAWVPFANYYILGKFIQERNGDPEWFKWVMSFYWLGSFIPIIGGILTAAGYVFTLVNKLRLMINANCGVLPYIVLFLFPILLPYTLRKYI